MLERVGVRTVAANRHWEDEIAWRTTGERVLIKGPALWPRAEAGRPSG